MQAGRFRLDEPAESALAVLLTEIQGPSRVPIAAAECRNVTVALMADAYEVLPHNCLQRMYGFQPQVQTLLNSAVRFERKCSHENLHLLFTSMWSNDSTCLTFCKPALLPWL